MLEFLNRSGASLWGFVSNGMELRLLRKNHNIARQPRLRFDVEALFEGESYSDFTLLWMICHESRLEGPPDASIIEAWRTEGIEDGERALDDLRDGVERAISTIGGGLISHPNNSALREALAKGAEDGGIDKMDLYQELLRLAYRLIFLFVAEDRDLLLDPAAPPEAKKRYIVHYSTRRLRDLAQTIRGGGHGDLWRALVTVMGLLFEGGCPELALAAFGSSLWDQAGVRHVIACALANRDLLAAIRGLAFTERNGALWPTDFRNLGSEELGSIYESLLELHPEVNQGAEAFSLSSAAGNARKTTGSFYTRPSLVERMLDEALDPVIDEASRSKDPEKALLRLRICDPAMGSGHFLTAAAQRVGKRLAEVRTGDPEPGSQPLRRAVRDIVNHCLYGVDVNPLAVELCKINLWMEALEPGRPLSFLDHHLKCGNSLIGATRAFIAKGIPEGAFDPITLDDKVVCREAKKRNTAELAGQVSLGDDPETLFPDYAAFARKWVALNVIEESTLEGVRLLASRYRGILESAEYQQELRAADAWCASFFIPKTRGVPEPLTQEIFARFLKAPERVRKESLIAVERASAAAYFFHWELAFPEVFRPQDGGPVGFDAVLGNPPWERIKLQETEWFAERDPEVAKAANAAKRKKMIEALKTGDAGLHREFQVALRVSEAASLFLRKSGRYPLCGKGDVNLYTVFTELGRSLLSPRGRLGILVPSGIATDDTTKEFFRDMVETRTLVSLYDFENHGLFPSVHSSYKFCLLTVAGSNRGAKAASRFVFFAHKVSDLEDENRLIELTADDFARINPNTRTAPIFRTKRDAEITRAVYQRVPVLIKEGPPEENPWEIRFMAMFHMANDSGLFQTRGQLEGVGAKRVGNRFVKGKEVWLPLYEAKMIHHFDHRWATYEGTETRDLTMQEKQDTSFFSLPRYWVAKSEVESLLNEKWKWQWLIAWRDICRSTDERTAIASLLPKCAAGDTALLMLPALPSARTMSPIVANLDSLILDYAARQKVGGTHLKYHVFKQLPVLAPNAYSSRCPWSETPGQTLAEWILPRVIELVYTADDMKPFAVDCGYSGSPFKWDVERRFLLRCELDAAFFHIYGISRDDVDYIMETFSIVKRHDEEKHGEYRTKKVILEIYDGMAGSIKSFNSESVAHLR
jgi:hypothetical protein